MIECHTSETMLIILLFCSRGFASGLFQSVYVYTPEAYPTNLRAVALGNTFITVRLLRVRETDQGTQLG